MLWLGVDVGGTFTDLVLFDVAAGKLQVLKTPSTPSNQSEGILAGIARLGSEPGRPRRRRRSGLECRVVAQSPMGGGPSRQPN